MLMPLHVAHEPLHQGRLPVPDGADTMNSRPLIVIYSTFWTCSRSFSSSAFAVTISSDTPEPVGLRTDGVDFAVHLLQQEIELAAAGLGTVAELSQCTRWPGTA